MGANGAYWQRLALPAAGTYSIVVAGAAGMAGLLTDRCRGAVITSSFYFQYGTVLYAMVGAMGGTDTSSAGGGGGTFVSLSNGTLLIAAGGGGGNWGVGFGTYTTSIYPGCDGSLLSTSGNSGSTGFAGGNNQQSAQRNEIGGQGGKGMVDILLDARGDTDGYYGGPLYCGGYGGGANLGGGGGYSGGGGIPYEQGGNYAGGGGSFCLAGLSNCQSVIPYNVGGNGFVNITFLS